MCDTPSILGDFVGLIAHCSENIVWQIYMNVVCSVVNKRLFSSLQTPINNTVDIKVNNENIFVTGKLREIEPHP